MANTINQKTDSKKNCQLKQVVIQTSVKTVFQNVLKGCSSLSSISFPKILTYMEKNAFYGCKSLQNVDSCLSKEA